MHDHDSHDADLARWLQEAGRRRVARKPDPRLPEVIGAPAEPAQTKPAQQQHIHHPRMLLLLAVAALSYLPYFFADVSVQISSLPRVIVFV